MVFNWGDPVIGVHRTFLSNNIKPGVIWSNTQQYSNERVDEILAQAAVANSDEERKALYDEFQMIVADELPIYWINLLPYHTAYNVRVQNVPVISGEQCHRWMKFISKAIKSLSMWMVLKHHPQPFYTCPFMLALSYLPSCI
ncbi:MAG: hypothetical protein R2865_02585 [Deinococcales bacterium]